MKTKISKHITYHEATFSSTASRLKINNEPGEDVLNNMKLVAKMCFEPLREWYGKPIMINSFYRSPELNRAVKGAKNSDHVKGFAIDLDTPSNAENKKLFEWCKKNLKYSQLIWEYGNESGPDWLHISYDPNNLKQQVLYIK
jgi:zinc D-Ala-D-Ala carboxypeptidase